jgi:hypothetical protein
MNHRGSFLRWIVAVCLVGITFSSLAVAGPFDWLSPDWWRPQPTTVYAPVTLPATTVYSPVVSSQTVLLPAVSTPAPATVAYSPVAQTCYYAPETRYRWVYGRMPVTTYRPVNVVDPCTGAVTTTYQPETRLTLLPWLHREPYTTYRLVCSPVATTSLVESVVPACDPCAPISETIVPSTVPPGSSCPPGCVPSTSATVVPGPTEAPAQPNGAYTPPQTFKGGSGPSASTSSPYSVQRPAESAPTAPATPSGPTNGTNPGAGSGPTINQPQFIQPSSKSASFHRPEATPRVAQYTAWAQPSVSRLQSAPGSAASSPVVTPAPPVNTGGWRPAGR